MLGVREGATTDVHVDPEDGGQHSVRVWGDYVERERQGQELKELLLK